MSNLTVAVLAPPDYAKDLGKKEYNQRHNLL